VWASASPRAAHLRALVHSTRSQVWTLLRAPIGIDWNEKVGAA
jgi:hypothetical protein